MWIRRLFAATILVLGIAAPLRAAATDSCANWPLWYRVANRDYRGVKACLDEGTDANTLNHGEPPIYQAVRNGDVPMLELLLHYEAHVNPRTSTGVTPLMAAAVLGDREVIRVLVHAGAEVDAQDKDGKTALIYAAIEGKADAVDALVRVGARQDLQYAYHENLNGTALMAAARNEDERIMRLLLAAGADVNAVGSSCQTALFWAAIHGRRSSAELLLNAGAVVNIIGWTAAGERGTPLEFARKNPDLLQLLRTRGRFLQVSPKDGCNVAPEPGNAAATALAFVDALRRDLPIDEILPNGQFRLRILYSRDGPPDAQVELRNDRSGLRQTVRAVRSSASAFTLVTDPISMPSNSGDQIRATASGLLATIAVRTPSIRLMTLREANGEIVHQFGDHESDIVVLAPDELAAPASMLIVFRAGPGPGVATISGEGIASVPVPEVRGAGGVMTAAFRVLGRGKGAVTIEWKTANAPVKKARFAIQANPFDLDVPGIPEAFEETPGGYVTRDQCVAIDIHRPVDPGAATTLYLSVSRLSRNAVRFFSNQECTSPIADPRWPASEAPRRLFAKFDWPEPQVVPAQAVLTLTVEYDNAAGGVVGSEVVDHVLLNPLSATVSAPANAEKDAGGAVLVHRNDDDDDGNNEKDFADRTKVVAREDDLLPIRITSSYFEVSVRAEPGLSIWTAAQKGPGTSLIDDADTKASRAATLTHFNRERTVYVEGIVAGRRVVTVEVHPSIDVDGEAVPLTQSLYASHSLQPTLPVRVVRADLDIDGLPDERNDEETVGVTVTTDDKAELRLSVDPSGAEIPGATVELAVPRGAAAVRLWKVTRDGREPLVLGSAGTVEFAPGPLPHIIVGGVHETARRGVAIELRYRAGLFVQRDVVTFTVAGPLDETQEITSLTLDPDWIVVPHEILPDEPSPGVVVPLHVYADSAHAKHVDVAAHPDTHFQWINLPVDEVPNPWGHNIPIARISVDSAGRLTVFSSGVQLLRARRNGKDSNLCFIIAGISLSDAAFEPEALLPSPGSDEPWLVLAADESSAFAPMKKGYLHLKDATFEVGRTGQTFALSDLRKVTDTVAALLPPNAKFLLALSAPVAGYVANQTVIDYESADDGVARIESHLLARGLVHAEHSGIASIEGTLNLESLKLGKASGEVSVAVLPVIRKVWVARANEGFDAHDDAIVIPAGQSVAVQARAESTITEHSEFIPKSQKGQFLARFANKTVDETWKFGELTMRVQGQAHVESKKNGKRAVVLTGVNAAAVLPPPMTDWHLTNNRVVLTTGGLGALLAASPTADGRPSHVSASMRKGIPDAANPFASSKVLSPLRMVTAEAIETTRCVAANPIFHIGEPPESVGALDRAFTDTPFRNALRGNQNAIAQALHSDHEADTVKTGAVSAGTPWSGGFVYFIEWPVVNPERCRLVFGESSVDATDGVVTGTHATPRGTLEPGPDYSVGHRRNPDENAFPAVLIFAGVHGWTGMTERVLRIERVERELSLRDASGVFRLDELWALQIALDGRKASGSTRAEFRKQWVGAGGGPVADTFQPTTELDAEKRFRGIAPP